MESLSSYAPSALILGAVFLVAVMITAARPHLRPDVRTSRRFAVVVGASILAQLLHFLEELNASFFARFPESLGLPPMPEVGFVAFNVAWLSIWVLSLLAVRAGWVVATCPLWFLGLATLLNLVAHPLLALRVGGYFPGLLTAPLVGVLGVLLLSELVRATAQGE